jgi:hypothetical protein
MAQKKTQPAKTKPARKATSRSKQGSKAKPKTVAKPQPSEKPIELPDGMWERIAKKAYELWEQRGRREGHALEDWLAAEAIVMEEIGEARK